MYLLIIISVTRLVFINRMFQGLETLKDGNIRESLENLIDTTIKDIDNSNKDVISNKPDSP